MVKAPVATRTDAGRLAYSGPSNRAHQLSDEALTLPGGTPADWLRPMIAVRRI